MRQCATKQRHRVAAIRAAAVIFQPSNMVRVLVKVAVRDAVVLATDQATTAAEIALDHVCVLAVAVAVGDRVIDPLGSELHFQSDRRAREAQPPSGGGQTC